jgi:hypothetical protein
MVPVTAAMLKQENGGEAANWFSLIPCECAPSPQGRMDRPSSTILLNQPDGLLRSVTRRVTSTQGMTVPETGNPLLALLYSL